MKGKYKRQKPQYFRKICKSSIKFVVVKGVNTIHPKHLCLFPIRLPDY